MENLKNYNIILGSKSPRRRELLEMLRIPFTVSVISDVKEEYPEDLPSIEIPEYIARLKGRAYTGKMQDDALVITADTLVILGERVLGKPADKDEAVEMLMMLSGKTHIVATGVAISTKRGVSSFTTITEVKFADIDPTDARYYVDTFLPLDKAGAYGIQEWIGAVAVEGMVGSYYNVMGLPVHQLYKELKKIPAL